MRVGLRSPLQGRATWAAVRALVVIGILGALGRVLWKGMDQVREVRATWDPARVLLGAGIVYVAILLIVLTWRRLLRRQGEEVGLGAATRIWFLSNLGRYIPGKVWQVIGVAYLARREGIAPLAATGTALLLHLETLLAVAVLGILLFPAHALPLLDRGGPLAWILAAAALVPLFPPLLRRLLARAAALLGRAAPAFPLRGGDIALTFLLVTVAWVVLGAGFFLFVSAFHPLGTEALAPCVGTFALAYLGGYLALFAPAGIGVREGIMALALGQILPLSLAAAIALAARVWMTAIELIPVSYYLGREGMGGVRRAWGEIRRGGT